MEVVLRAMKKTLREHWHFLLVVSALTALMTFPTILYVFRTDVFWLPTGSSLDAIYEVWNVWYLPQILSGKQSYFHTSSLFFPQGVSLAYHPLFALHSIAANILQLLIPFSNAFSLAHLLTIFTCALGGYIYLLWLFKDKWLALFGAIVFGFSPNALGGPHVVNLIWIAPIPLVMYCFHRGFDESRTGLLVLAGVIAGLSSTVNMYQFVIILIVLGLWLCALAWARWRDADFWRLAVLLVLAIALASAWRVAPMLQDTSSIYEKFPTQGNNENDSDLLLNFGNRENPLQLPFLEAVFPTLDNFYSPFNMSYIGYLPLALILFGLFSQATRRKMLPWLGLALVFLILRLGSVLTVNGITYEHILLPKYFLNQLLPPVFQAFHSSEHFMAGARVPIAVMSCYGLVALCQARRAQVKPWLILLLILIVAAEYYNPVEERRIAYRSFEYLSWLAEEENSDDIALINLPMGRKNSKHYLLFQSQSGFPQVEGTLTRVPANAYDYIEANALLNAWRNDQAVICQADTKADYLAALEQLETDGFTHVVLHHHIGQRNKYYPARESLELAQPAYADQFVSVYRLAAIRRSCPSA